MSSFWAGIMVGTVLAGWAMSCEGRQNDRQKAAAVATFTNFTGTEIACSRQVVDGLNCLYCQRVGGPDGTLTCDWSHKKENE